MKKNDDVSISLIQQYSLEEAKLHLTLVQENVMSDNIFLSSHWLYSWLESLSSLPQMCLFNIDNKLIGIAFLGKQHCPYGDIYYLNQTGRQADDQVWIEHNDVFCMHEKLVACREALLGYLSRQPKFHKLIVSLCKDENWRHKKIFLWETDMHPTQYVDIAALRKQAKTHLESTSKNSRSSIKRSQKYIESKYGPISMHKITDSLDALIPSEIAPLHIEQWGETEYGSGFANPRFVNFHKIFCSQAPAHINIEVLKFSAGEFVLGYLYFINKGNSANFYLSAINYSDKNNKYKPGLVMHTMAISDYAAKQYDAYDFLAGEARYKESLSNGRYNMYTLHLANKRPLQRILFNIKVLKQKLGNIKG